VDYDDTWNVTRNAPGVFASVHRAYSEANVTLRRPAILRLPLLSRISGAVNSVFEVVRVLSQKKTDVVVLYGLPTVGVQTLIAARAFRVPVIFRAIDVSHELVPHPILVFPTKILEKIIFRSVKFNVALTPHLKQYIHACGVPDSAIRLLPSGVDAQMFSPGPPNPQLLARWGVGEHDRIVLFMGTIYRFSGLDTVIQSFDSVVAQCKNAKLLIVGAGEDEARLRGMAARTGVADKVIFTGMQPYSILPDVIRSSTVCINPFELNGITRNILPTKLFQYMTCSKPVLATSLPGTRTFLSGEEHGVVYAELSEFNQRLLELLSDENRCEQLGSQGREAASKYDWRSIGQTMSAWLEEAARG
jgi:glycosyltransferase involved in cell wall biosynthesis